MKGSEYSVPRSWTKTGVSGELFFIWKSTEYTADTKAKRDTNFANILADNELLLDVLVYI